MPKTSSLRMITSLEEMGFLQKDNEGYFSLGLAFLEYGQLVSQRMDIRKIALPIMEQFRDEVGEAVNLIVRDKHQAIYIEKVDTDQPVRLFTAVGRRSPLHAGACSRILLAFLPEEEQNYYIEKADLSLIGNSKITERSQLRELIKEAKLNKYAVSHSELVDHTFSISAPIFNHTCQVIAGLSVAGPDSRFTESRIPMLISKVQHYASLISKELGGNFDF